MYKTLVALAVSVSLTACGGGGGSDPEPKPEPQPEPDSYTYPDTDISDNGQALGSVNFDSDSKVSSITNTLYGTFTVDESGNWSYESDNTADGLYELIEDEFVKEEISITEEDGSTHQLAINIEGQNDSAVFGSGEGVSSGHLNEEAVQASGQLTVVDPDNGQSAFVAVTLSGDYGTFSIDEDGNWQYNRAVSAESNSQFTDAKLQTSNLKTANESPVDGLVDQFTVESVGGDSALVTITLDAPTTSGNGYPAEQGGNFVDGYTDNVPEVNCTQTFSSISALENAANYSLTPGTTLCLADGTYQGLELSFGGTGTPTEKITVAAENPGKAIIDGGEVQIIMAGEHVTLQGLVLKNGNVDYNLIKTKGNSLSCNYCRITEMTITDMDDGVDNPDDAKKWIEIYGAFTRLDHNWISGKTSRGALLVVDRYSDEDDFDEDTFEQDFAQIDYNYFGDRPPIAGKAYADSSDNEYEGIRIGLSTTHSGDSFSVVEHNYFERIQGEAEVISNKAGSNTIRHNTVRDSYGSIVTRHGEKADISNNFIIGDDHPYSGGIRLVDGGHTVTNNYIEGARYLASNWNGGIVLTSGDGSGDSENGYQDVENVLVAYNTIVDSVNSLNVFGGKEKTEPDNVYFVNNLIASAVGAAVKNSGDMPTNSTFASNYVEATMLADEDNVTVPGMSLVDARFAKDDKGIYRPSDNSPDLSADLALDLGSFTLPSIDMDGQTRGDQTYAGADDVQATPALFEMLTADDVGPKSYVASAGKIHVDKVAIANHDFDSGDLSSWTASGAQISQDVEEVFSRGSSLVIDTNNGFAEQAVAIEPNKHYTLSAFVKGQAKLEVEVNGEPYASDVASSSYKFATVYFYSGDATSATIRASVDDLVDNHALITNPNFDDKQEGWTAMEGTGIGQVQDSSNSSTSTDGSIKFKWNVGEDTGTPYQPYIAQTIEVEPNTSYTLSMYQLLKSGKTGSTIRFGAFAEDDSTLITNATVIAEKESVYADLESSGADKGEDSFLQDTLTFETGNATSLTVFAQLQTTTGDEIRVDEFSASYKGEPEEGSKAYFDSFRLVSHSRSPEDSATLHDN